METIQAPIAQGEIEVPSVSALLKDPSVDHLGAPISVEYKGPWRTEASDDMGQHGPLSGDDLEAIRFKIAPAAAMREMENGNNYCCTAGPIGDRHPGLEGAKIVPVKLNIVERYSIDSPARDKALRENDFKARLARGLPKRLRPSRLTRWRLSNPSHPPTRSYPSDYIVWENPETEKLYARIPKPLEDMDRGACDHCRIHNQKHPKKHVEYIDDRPAHVYGTRSMSAGDTAITPFSLCRFHWWYVMSGELLRESQVRALEILVSEDLLERWGVSHMREFLRSMSQQISTAAESLDDDMAGKRPPSLGLAPGACLNTVGSAVLEELENLQLSSARGATVASADAHQTVPGGRPATATTAEGPSDTKAGDQASLFEGGASSPAKLSTPVQIGSQGWSDLCSGAPHCGVVHPPKAGSYYDGEPASQANGLIMFSCITTDTTPQTTGATATQANGLVAPSPAAPVTHSQGNGTPTPRKDGFLRSPPKEPRAMRAMREKAAKQAKAYNPNPAHSSKRSREDVLLPQHHEEAWTAVPAEIAMEDAAT